MKRILTNEKSRGICMLMLTGLLLTTTDTNGQHAGWAELITPKVGLDSATAFSLYVCDLNNDHYPDIVAVKGGWNINAPNNMRSYINIRDTSSNNPSGRMFVDITPGSGINSMPIATDTSKGTLVAAFADINNDGNIDMVRGSYYHDNPAKAPNVRPEVLLGNGEGQFNIVPDNGLHELGLTNVTAFSFLDYNKDGNLDLFIARWFIDYQKNKWQPGLLMRGNGDGTFTDVSPTAGITTPEPMYGSTVIDWNNDGWPDIATSPYCRTGGQLWKNNGDGTFTDIAGQTGYNAQAMQGDNGQNLCMFGSAAQDFDNDGDMDFLFCLVHGGSDHNEGRSTIVVNDGADSSFKLKWDINRITWKQPRSSHHGDYDASWFDIDNDGLMDIALAQGTYVPATDRLFVFHQKPDNTFMDITADIGLLTNETKDMHHVEALDFDLDGDDDLITCKVGSGSPITFIENKTGQDNNWLGIRLNAPSGVNKSSIGARIYLWSGGVQRMREIYAGRGNNSGQQPFSVLFGTGKNTTVDSVKVIWPDSDRHYTVVHPTSINKYIEIGPEVSGVVSNIKTTDQSNSLPQLKVYPNPAGDFILLQLNSNAAISKVEIYNIFGQRISIKTFRNGDITQYCPVTELLPGNYIVKTTDDKGAVFKTAFVKR